MNVRGFTGNVNVDGKLIKCHAEHNKLNTFWINKCTLLRYDALFYALHLITRMLSMLISYACGFGLTYMHSTRHTI